MCIQICIYLLEYVNRRWHESRVERRVAGVLREASKSLQCLFMAVDVERKTDIY